MSKHHPGNDHTHPRVTVHAGQQAPQQPVPGAPAAQEAPAVTGAVIVTDGLGRRLTLEKPPFFAQFDLARNLGDDSANAGYMARLIPLLYLTAIDDAITPTPSNYIEVKALVTRLGEEGYKTLVAEINKRFFAEEKSSQKDNALKNS